jgi:hypothetical protein
MFENKIQISFYKVYPLILKGIIFENPNSILSYAIKPLANL